MVLTQGPRPILNQQLRADNFTKVLSVRPHPTYLSLTEPGSLFYETVRVSTFKVKENGGLAGIHSIVTSNPINPIGLNVYVSSFDHQSQFSGLILVGNEQL